MLQKTGRFKLIFKHTFYIVSNFSKAVSAEIVKAHVSALEIPYNLMSISPMPGFPIKGKCCKESQEVV